MTIEEMKLKKRELGYTYALLSLKSGVPVPTIQKIFHGETKSPRFDTLQALEKAFRLPGEESHSFYHTSPETANENSCGTEEGQDQTEWTRQGTYTVEDYLALPEEKRVELIDGVFYDMGAPASVHQLSAGEIYRQISNYIIEQEGSCIPFISPIDVQLDCDDRTMVQPDVVILCSRDKSNPKRLVGAPDFVLEVLSPSTKKKDSVIKLYKYMNAGVREYWMLDPYRKVMLIYFFEKNDMPKIVGLDEPIPVGIYDGKLKIDPKHIVRWIDEFGTEQA